MGFCGPLCSLLAPRRERQDSAPENQLGQETRREEQAARGRPLAQRRSQPLACAHEQEEPRCPHPRCPPRGSPPRGKARTNLRGVHGGGWWLAVVTIQRVSVQCCVHLRACQGGGVSTRCPIMGCTPLEHPSWCTVRTHLGVPVELFGLGVLLGALLPTQTGGSELGGHGRGVPRGAGWCWGAHLGTFVGQGAALLQLAEEEDGAPRAAGGQRLPAHLRRCCAEGTCWGRTLTAGSTQLAPGGRSGWDKPPRNPSPGEGLKAS